MAVQSVQVPPALATVLNRAGDRSGVDFDYLVRTAMRESSFDPAARAPTSSAVGLFQFIESTWFEVMKTDGPRLGYGEYARAIERTPDGDFVVQNNEMRQKILALREDPQISADLAAAFTRNNGEYLAGKFGRSPSPGELYIAHFLGARGAEKLFRAGLDNPDRIAAELFPRQARANRAIFYDADGARTIREVYQNLVARHARLQTGAQPSAPASAPGEADSEPGPQPRHGPAVQLRQPDVSFDAMYRADRSSTPRSVVVDPGAAFFVQLYNR